MTDVLTRARSLPAAAPAAPQPTADAPAGLRGTVAECLVLAVAPTTGRFRPAPTAAEAGPVRAGALLGHITGGGGRADAVVAPADARLERILVRPGQLVTRGQALVWLSAADAA